MTNYFYFYAMLMLDNITIKELKTRNEIMEAFPVMSQLRTHIDETAYLELVSEAQEKEGYKMFALFDDNDLVAVIGFRPMITLYYGRFIWVCDLVTDVNKRSGDMVKNYFHIFINGRKKINMKVLHYLRDYSEQMHTVFTKIKWGMTK